MDNVRKIIGKDLVEVKSCESNKIDIVSIFNFIYDDKNNDEFHKQKIIH